MAHDADIEVIPEGKWYTVSDQESLNKVRRGMSETAGWWSACLPAWTTLTRDSCVARLRCSDVFAEKRHGEDATETEGVNCGASSHHFRRHCKC